VRGVIDSDHILALLSILLLVITACGPHEEPSTSAGPGQATVPVIQGAVKEVRNLRMPITIEVTGQVAATAQATLSSKIQGIVQEVRVREGDAVAKGQILLVLDSRDLQAELARAEAEAENARAHLARMERLFTEESVAKQELENARRTAKVAEAGKQAALAQRSYTVIKAPFEGIITDKKIEAGELASPAQALLKIEDPRRLRLEATVAEGDLGAILPGEKIAVVIDALPSGPALQGTVSQILPTGDPNTHTVLVKVNLPPTKGLRAGMFGRMQFSKGTIQALVIPKSALLERGQLSGAYVVESSNVMHLRWIKVGRSVPAGAGEDDSVEVLSGLNAGERVLADGAKGIDGARVQAP
jgi:RND family efflux transporter MFP subunit